MLRERPCRVNLATSRREDDRIPEKNWREGHHIVERPFATRSEESRPRAAPASSFANWRETAKPVETAEVLSSAQQPQGPARKAAIPPHAQQRRSIKLDIGALALPTDKSDALATEEYSKSGKPNPFGVAKPREIVLAEKKTESEE